MPPVTSASGASRGTALKIVLSVVAVTGAIGFLLSRSLKEGVENYKHVDEVMAAPESFRSKRLQVHGNVVNDSIEQVKGTLQYRFKIETGAMSKPAPRRPAVITATYTGIVPDTFKSGAEVVARGSLGPDNVLAIIPDGIMAKCPSKYDAEKGSPLSSRGPAAATPSEPAAAKL